ncbi:Oxysterol-binding proteinc-like protein [Hapsidospora chrysogenum ATCC 11550]|uniref:Oxysterol-binding proteinc-like protein n=1 Tax=Hapsidospora chrysogenum (strain ATCC 11550 / CBS 779.69 / DSM 880 / IAM 14645 / JCM 23072 / IMI 49137) TaxID=857340 RepID=A0A086T029_HAPC1|nr:Oxysterol-binding proteinc-like protein [Hapsidospora chrysogenum ATCC 11550]
MSDAGDSSQPSHKRSMSAAALNLLRRKETREDESSTDEASVSASPKGTARPAMSHQHNVRSQGGRLSTSGAALSRTPSAPAAAAAAAAASATAAPLKPTLSNDKGPSLEQSVKKFRIVEALRSGDTASISRAIRESGAGPRTSISSMTGGSGSGLEDTTILHLAIQCAEFPVVEYVLSDGQNTLDINARDKDGNTPLHVAAAQGRTPVVKLLLEHKDINDAIVNAQGKFAIDLARNPEIFQLLQLSRSLFTEAKIEQVQDLITKGDYETLAQVLEEPRFKTVVDINSPEFASEPMTVSTGGTLLHEAARRKNIKLIQALLLHGADPFRRDRKGKLPQNITNDDNVKAILKRSPAAVAAQRGIQEKAVLGHAASQGAMATGSADRLAGREAREMKGYLKKWTNYRKGYQLRWFVLEDGVLSYYKNQDDSGSACRGAINMRIAKLHMSPDEKTKFEIHGKSSVKYTLKANHEVEAKRWFWSLNNSIQWTKDQDREEERQAARNAELLKQAKAEQSGSLSVQESHSENASVSDLRRNSSQYQSRSVSSIRASAQRTNKTGPSTVGSIDDEDFADAGTEGDASRVHGNGAPLIPGEMDDEDDYGDEMSVREEPSATRDALNITAQSAKLQLETMSHVQAALVAESTRSPATPISDTKVMQALSTYDGAIRSLTGLIGDLLRISKDRDAYWQYRLERESSMRRMWEDSMAQVAKEQEELQARLGEAEAKRKLAKRALREVMEGAGETPTTEKPQEEIEKDEDVLVIKGISRRPTALEQMAEELSEDESDNEEEFFDAVDAGEVEVSEMPLGEAAQEKGVVVSGGIDISSSFKGYENGIRHRLKMDADDRPKISLWGILKSMIGKDMTKMTLPVSFNEPTSLLYRCGEDMEYADLLDLAADRADSIERLVYVAAFAASEYASTIGRVAKPFNPLLGETFEYVRPDKNYRFFIEQVSHHPPIGAAWAEAPRWTYWGESHVKSKFYGKSFDINPLGTWFLKLRPTAGGKEELYTWKKVTSSVVGIITGNPTVDNYGPMEVKNWTTGEVAQLEFKPRGWKASSAYQIGGKIIDADGKTRVSMGGRWNSRIYARLTPGYEAAVDEPAKENGPVHRGSLADPTQAYLVWQANPRPAGIPFNLTPFVLTFNHIDDKLRPWIAPTDSRLRPDQRAMEDGEYDFAATEKNRLEEAQRARRRIREARGEEFTPAWFTRARCEVTGEEYWKFNGKYWELREKAGPDGDPHVWDGLEPIYSDAPDDAPA